MKLKLVQTCEACPEQYDAYLDGQKVGYLRLRWGCCIASCGTEQVYTAQTNGDGQFADEAERRFHLNRACAAIIGYLVANGRLEGDLYEMGSEPGDNG